MTESCEDVQIEIIKSKLNSNQVMQNL